MDEDDIEVLKESCLNDLFQDSSEKDDWSSSCQIQISSVFSLASPDCRASLDTNFNIDHLQSKQFDSEAILNNLPNNPSVSSTTTEASRDGEGETEWTSSTKQNETPSDSIKNDDGEAAQENVNDAAREVSDQVPTKTTDAIEGEGSKKFISVKTGEEDLTSSSKTSDDVPLPEWDEVTSTTTCDPTPPSPPDVTPPPPPAPVTKFKTDLSQFFSKEPRPPVASQGGQNVIPATGEDKDDDEENDGLYTQRKVMVKIPKDLRRPRAPPQLAATPPPPAVDPVTPVKRKRGRPKGSKNKKKFVPSLSSLPPKCKRCVFLRKIRW